MIDVKFSPETSEPRASKALCGSHQDDDAGDGRKYRTLSIIDEASRECLALPVVRKLRSDDVLAALADLFVTRGPPVHIRSDNDPEFIAMAVQQWLAQVGVKTLYIAP